MSSISDRIKAAKDIKLEKCHVPEWNETIWVRSVTGEEWGRFQKQALEGKGRNREANTLTFNARLVALAACDESGACIFTSDDIEWLKGKSHKALDRIARTAIQLNAFGDEEVEELVKN